MKEHIRKGAPAWLVYLLAGILAAGVYFLLPSAATQHVFPALVDLALLMAIVAGILLNRPSHPLPWYLFALGVGLNVAGNVPWTAYLLGAGEPYASTADVLYVAALPFFVASLSLVGGKGIGRHGGNLIDALIIATGAGMFSWVLLGRSEGDGSALSLLDGVLPIVPLLAYVVMLAIAIRPLFVPEKRVPALYLVLGGLVVFVLADVALGSAVLGTYAGYEAGSPFYAGQLVSDALLGAAALHPSMVALSEPAPEQLGELTWWRLLLLTGALLMAPGLVVLQAALDQTVNVSLIVGGSAALFLLIAARLAGMIAERKTLEQRLEFQASHDPLTRLPNRSLFTERFEQSLARAERQGTKVALLFVDLDNFKEVNDSSGHQAGDRVLVAVAKRLRACIRPSDTVARLGGDEFAVLLEDLDDPRGAVRVAECILKELRTPVSLGELEAIVGASIGIALASEAQEHLGDLLRKADLALYRAKGRGKDAYEIFDPDLGNRIKL